MALQKFHCLNCDKDFESGNWNCASGETHIVAEKTYYVRDAPADKRDCKNARLNMNNVIPESKVMEGQDTIVVPGVHIVFVRGQYETNNPRIQMNLDKRHNVYQGESGLKQWEQDYFSDAEKVELRERALKAQISRLENEKNSLLADVQNRTKQQARPNA